MAMIEFEQIHSAGPLSKTSRYKLHFFSKDKRGPNAKELRHLIRMLELDIETLEEAEKLASVEGA